MKGFTVYVLLFVLIAIVVPVANCGHGTDADPYDPIIGETDPSELSGRPIYTQEKYAKYAAEGMALDLLETSSDIIKTMGFTMMTFPPNTLKASRILDRIGLEYKEVVIHKEDGAGDSASATGTVISVCGETLSCVIFSTLDIEYDSYCLNPNATISGSGRAKLILTSFGCKYQQNLHADIAVTGNFQVETGDPDAGYQTFDELQFEVDYDIDDGTELAIQHAEFNTDNGIRYCFESSGSTECLSTDYREPEEINTCSASDLTYRECDPSEEWFFTASRLSEEEEPTIYEVPVICTGDGLWSPPCSTGGSFNICPTGTACVASRDIDWGYGLDGYGLCSCISQ